VARGWSSAAVDDVAGYAYFGVGNPASAPEHENMNSVIKVDLTSLASPTFGQIVDRFKGDIDQYADELEPLQDTPACAASQGTPLSQPTPVGNPACAQFDLDIGASPNLFRVGDRTYVGALQKSGRYHAADTTTMDGVWAATVGAPCFQCNGSSPAAGPEGIYGNASGTSVAFALDRATGTTLWTTPTASPFHYYSTSVANDVVYTIDLAGSLLAHDASSGAPLLKRPLLLDVGAPTANISSAGVSIARHTVFVGAAGGLNPKSDGWIVAYRPST